MRIMRALLRGIAAAAALVLIPAGSGWAQQDAGSAAAPTPTPEVTPEVAGAWGFDASDVPPDPDVRFGVLANGMRYALRHNDTPQETAVVRFAIEVGSTSEDEDQLGVAHFIEHMAFNGSTHVPEGEMVKILERYGLAFGADTNASTSYGRTIYQLDLPNVKEELVDTALFLMRETASEISFDPGAIDRERGVILSELRDRTNYAQRNSESLFAFAVPDTRIASRSPIGTREVIESIPAQRFRDFYNDYYTPGRATLVVVGDIDVDAVEAKIRAEFGDWTAVNGEQSEVDPGKVDTERGDLVNVFSHPAVSESVTVMRFAPYRDEADTILNRRERLLRSIAYNIIGRRLGRLARSENPPFLGASIGRSDVFRIVDQSVLQVGTADGEWRTGLAAAEAEVRRALEHGFTEAEVVETVANYRASFENRANGAATRRNDDLADELLYGALEDTVVSPPGDQYSRFLEGAREISPETVLRALREDFRDLDRPLFHITSKTPIPGAQDEVLALWKESRALAVAPPEAAEVQQFAYTDFGAPGTVVSDERIEDLGIRTIRFANNVRLNLKPTDFEDDRVRVSLRIDGGKLLATRDNPEAVSLMNIYALGGLKAHSIDDLLTIFAGRSVTFDFDAGEDYLGSYLVTIPEDLELQFELLAAFATAPGYRAEALRQYRGSLPNFFARLDATPQSALGAEIGGILSDGDPRFALASEEVYESLDFAGLDATIGDRLAHGAIEIGLVGDFDEEEAIAIVARTFGALPEREAEFRDYADRRVRPFTRDRSAHTLTHRGEENQALITYFWPTTDDDDPDTNAALGLLAQLLQVKVTDEIRENLGASYSPQATSFTSAQYDDFGYIQIATNVDVKDVAMVEDAIRRIADALSETPPAVAECETPPPSPISHDEFARARTPLRESLINQVRDNGTWLGLVDQAQSRPDLLDRFRVGLTTFDNVSEDALIELARRYLKPEDAVLVRAVHAKRIADWRPDAATDPAIGTD